jgi:hypothetical protein
MSDRRQNGGREVALWAGITTLFTNIAAINLLSLLGDETKPHIQAIAAFVTSLCVAASVYAKHRWDYAKALTAESERRNKNGTDPQTPV